MGLARDLSTVEFPPRNSYILAHDNASTGFPEWQPLFDSNQPRGMGGFDGHALVIHCEDRPATGDNAAQFTSSAFLNRCTMPSGAVYAYRRIEWGIELLRGTNFIKGPQFGFDVNDGGDPESFAPAHGNRHLMMLRCAMFDESSTTYFGGKWQIQTGDATAPTWTNITDTDGAFISPFKYPRIGVGQNYNKRLRQRTEILADVAQFKIVGLRHNGVGFGLFPDTTRRPAQSLLETPNRVNLASYTPAAAVDDQFINGWNLYSQLDGRSTQKSAAKLYVFDDQTVVF